MTEEEEHKALTEPDVLAVQTRITYKGKIVAQDKFISVPMLRNQPFAATYCSAIDCIAKALKLDALEVAHALGIEDNNSAGFGLSPQTARELLKRLHAYMRGQTNSLPMLMSAVSVAQSEMRNGWTEE